MTTATKPPTQTLGVSGIAPKPVNTPDQGANWPAIAALPPFQMFLAEKHPETQQGDSYLNAIEILQQRHDDGLLEEYETWHKAKGYWPSETPFGEPRPNPDPDPVSIANAAPKDSEVA